MSALTTKGCLLLLAAAVLVFAPVEKVRAADEGIALAIVYDTSGSMAESVPAGGGRQAPKYIIANKALSNIIDRISVFATNTTAGAPRKVEAGLFVFRGDGSAEAVKFGPFNRQSFQDWVRNFNKPTGNTPLGNSINAAAKAVLASDLPRKHIVILTDGINTAGPKPEAVIPGLKAGAAQKSGTIAFHFVAFDVDAKVFDPVKAQGATVLGAANELQLNTQLEYIFEKKILLEEEEPKAGAADKSK